MNIDRAALADLLELIAAELHDDPHADIYDAPDERTLLAQVIDNLADDAHDAALMNEPEVYPASELDMRAIADQLRA